MLWKKKTKYSKKWSRKINLYCLEKGTVQYILLNVKDDTLYLLNTPVCADYEKDARQSIRVIDKYISWFELKFDRNEKKKCRKIWGCEWGTWTDIKRTGI